MAELWDVLDENGNITGRLHQRGIPLSKGEFHRVVIVWVVNSKNEFLISKRSPNIPAPNIWQPTGGSAVAGDDSLKTALKETREEIGIILNPENGTLLSTHKVPHYPQEDESFDLWDEGGALFDVWLFRQDVDIADVVLDPEETCDAMWASSCTIRKMIDAGEFSANKSYFEEIFDLIGV